MPESMILLETNKHFRGVRDLPFCYLCGNEFDPGDAVDRDHVPPRSAFNARDREPPLKLKTHKSCHSSLSDEDKRIGQLISLRRRERPRSLRDQALKIVKRGETAAVVNINIDTSVWRWVRGFHAALYRQPLSVATGTLRTPFPRADLRGDKYVLQPLMPQHALIVESIKRNRAFGNIDRIVCNNGKLRYDCVWGEADDHSQWICMFGLDIYDWKDLGSHTDAIPARGC